MRPASPRQPERDSRARNRRRSTLRRRALRIRRQAPSRCRCCSDAALGERASRHAQFDGIAVSIAREFARGRARRRDIPKFRSDIARFLKHDLPARAVGGIESAFDKKVLRQLHPVLRLLRRVGVLIDRMDRELQRQRETPATSAQRPTPHPEKAMQVNTAT